MSQVKKVVTAIAISMSFFCSDVVYAEKSEIAHENNGAAPVSEQILHVVAEKYFRVVRIYEEIPKAIRQSDLKINTEDDISEIADGGVLIVEVAQRAVLLATTEHANYKTEEQPKRKPGHTHEETQHEIEKIGPEEDAEI